MDIFLTYPKKEQALLFEKAQSELNISSLAVLEKDFWVCWILQKISEIPELKENLIFKGGTSLSKVYNLIERFSEDIDLIINRDYLDLNYSTTNPEKEKKKIRKACKHKIESNILPLLKDKIQSILKDSSEWKIVIDPKDSQSILFYFPTVFYKNLLTEGGDFITTENNEPFLVNNSQNYKYIKPFVKLEFGSLSIDNPHEFKKIKPYVHSFLEKFLEDYDNLNFNIEVNTIDINRTFWEKVTILHTVACSNKKVPARYSRHYYDIYQFIINNHYQKALEKTDLLQKTIQNNLKFFNDKNNNFETKLGSLKLIPNNDKIEILKSDYLEMNNMFFKDVPSFENIMESVGMLEKIINNL